MTGTAPLDDASVVPDFLQRRNLPPNPSGSKGFLSDVEVIILSLLDDEGKLSQKDKLQDFMVILARMEAVEQRAMAIEIIRHHIPEALHTMFVSYGGFRLLKDWLEDAEKDRHLHFLIAVIKLCRILPFDKLAIKQSEIGKMIRKLTRFESRRKEQLEVLKQEVDLIMKEWRDKQQLASQLEREQNEELKLKEEQANARKQEIEAKEESTTQQKQSQSQQLKVESQPQNISSSLSHNKKTTTTTAASIINSGSNASIVNESKESEMAVEEVKPKVEAKKVLSSGSHSKPIVVPSVAPLVVPPKVPAKSTPLLTALLQNQVLQQQPNAFTVGAAATAPKSQKRTIDMVQGAHELLNQSSNRASSPNERVLAEIDLKMKPLGKGGLKKKDESSKKEKKSIRWADEEGGNLREVQTIEVDRIKSSVANYKSHKDLVKREKQIEKETHLSKTSEAMHATTSWRTPKPLTLTIDIIDNIGRPENSTEIATQTKRLSILMETKYLDESLIPPDPDRSLADEDAANNSGPKDPPIIIPWLMNEEVDEDALLMRSLQQPTAPSSSSSLYNNVGGMGMAMDFSTMSTSTPGLSSSSSSMSMSSIPIDYSMQIAQLPRAIQMLDPMTLQMVLEDPVVLQSLLKADGGVDEVHLDILQNCSSIDEYRQAISFVSAPSTIGHMGGGGWQNEDHFFGNNHNNNLLFNNNALNMNMNINMNSMNNANQNTTWGMNPNNMNSGINMNNPPGVVGNVNLAAILNNLNNNLANMNSNSNMMNNNMGQASSSTFSIPSVGLDLTTIDGSRLSKPTSKSSSNLSTRATIPCKFFNTLRGCANGDKCPFGHFRQNTTAPVTPMPNAMTAAIVSNLMGDGAGAQQRRGPGARGGGRGPGQKGGKGGFRS